MLLPTLYKRGAAAGVMLQWTVWSDGDLLFTEHGQVGGRLIRSAGNRKKGKNIGRSNATTPTEQADAEAKAAWEKRIKRGGYKGTIAEAKDYLHSVPMLAHKYPEHLEKGKVEFPVLVQPKLDGLRVLAYWKGETVVLQSRKLTYYTAPKHIIAELKHRLIDDQERVLDGELYCHDMTLNEINSAGKKYHKGQTERLQFHVYDSTYLNEQGQRQEDRLEMVREHFKDYGETEHIREVLSVWRHSDDGVQRLFGQFVADGYEGAIIRTLDNTYEFDTRSHGLLKLKDHQEEEFEIVAVKAGSGKAANWPVFTCANPKGTKKKTFEVLPKGDDKTKRRMLAEGPLLIGRMLTVRFHQWTAYVQPEHPRGITIREDI